MDSGHLTRRAMMVSVVTAPLAVLFPAALLNASTEPSISHPKVCTDKRCDDTKMLQSLLDRRGTVHLTRSYVITATLFISSHTQIVGDADAQIVWRGPDDHSVIQSSSDPGAEPVTTDILLSGFEVIGDSRIYRNPSQVAICFYKTANVTIRGLTVHGFGGSGIRWGNSFADTRHILVEQCTVYDCWAGDGIQGSGREICIRNNKIGINGNEGINFGDSGIAIIFDFEAATNPDSQHSSNIAITGNTIVGNLQSSKNARPERTQTGIAIGPFKSDAKADLLIADNRIASCNVSIWLIVMRDVIIANNVIGPHLSKFTGNVRLDGISQFSITGNDIAINDAGSGPDFSAIFLNAGRSVFGSSQFDANVEHFGVEDNTIRGAGRFAGVRLSFGHMRTSPKFISRVADGSIRANRFVGLEFPVAFAPESGEPAYVCENMTLRNNTIDDSARALAVVNGNHWQYVNLQLLENVKPPHLRDLAGTGLKNKH